MTRWCGWTLAAALALTGCGAAQTLENAGSTPAPPAPPAPDSVPPPTSTMLPRGTELRVVLNDTLSSEKTSVGDRFTVTAVDSLLTVSRQVVVPAGATITGLVTGVDDSDHAGDEAYIRLNFVRLSMGKANHPFAAEVVGTQLKVNEAGGELKDVAIDAAAGVLGAVLSGDLKTAAESAGLGVGAGTVISLGNTGAEAILPAGTAFRIRTTVAISLAR